MACYRPIRGYRAPGGRVTFTPVDGYVDRHVEVSCGQCVACRLERSRQWAVRCVHEAQMHDANCFITLTYDEEHLPPDGSLDVKHWQLFAKNLRRRVGPFRYFHCGEYGDSSARPHYHAAVFGVDFASDRQHWKTSGGNRLYVSPTLDEAWGRGYALIGALSFESAAYVARYVMKKITGEKATAHYEGRKPEYTTMSRRPGIGSSWLEKFGSDVYPRDEVITQGRRARPPKFYDSQFDQVVVDQVKARRRAEGSKHSANNTWDRLKTREKVDEARLRTFSKREPSDS